MAANDVSDQNLCVFLQVSWTKYAWSNVLCTLAAFAALTFPAAAVVPQVCLVSPRPPVPVDAFPHTKINKNFEQNM